MAKRKRKCNFCQFSQVHAVMSNGSRTPSIVFDSIPRPGGNRPAFERSPRYDVVYNRRRRSARESSAPLEWHPSSSEGRKTAAKDERYYRCYEYHLD